MPSEITPLPRAKKRPTLRDISVAAKVSPSAVSAALSGSDSINIAESTRQRILRISEDMGYQRRFLRAKDGNNVRSSSILWVDQRLALPRVGASRAYANFYLRHAQGIASNLEAKGYHALLKPPAAYEALARVVEDTAAEGVIWCCSDEAYLPVMDRLSRLVPVVLLHYDPYAATDMAALNEPRILQVALDHLLKAGHRKIVYYGERGNIFSHRMRGFERIAQAFREEHDLVFEDVKQDAVQQRDVFHHWLKYRRDFTAVIMTDSDAVWFLRRAGEENISIPDEVSVLGIDNVEADDHTTPRLSSIDLNIDAHSQAAVAMLAQRIREPDRPIQQVLIEPQIVERESVARIAGGHRVDLP